MYYILSAFASIFVGLQDPRPLSQASHCCRAMQYQSSFNQRKQQACLNGSSGKPCASSFGTDGPCSLFGETFSDLLGQASVYAFSRRREQRGRLSASWGSTAHLHHITAVAYMHAGLAWGDGLAPALEPAAVPTLPVLGGVAGSSADGISLPSFEQLL